MIDENELPNTDEEFADDIITLITDDGEEIDFVEIAGVAHNGEFYAILQPVEILDELEEDEALVFKVSCDENGEDKFEIELDDQIIDAVFDKYYELLDDASNEE